jgi:hypothetical protein
MKMADTGTDKWFHNGPYSTEDEVQARLVAVGVRVTPIMAAQQMAGLLTTSVGQNHSNLNNYTLAENTTRPTSATTRTNAQGVFTSTGGVRDSEFEYSSETYPYSTGAYSTVDTSNGGAVIQINGSSDVTGQPYYVEVVMHAEYTGVGIGATGTSSHADPIGFSVVSTAQSKVHEELVGVTHNSPSGYASAFSRVLADVAAELTPTPQTLARGVRAVAGYGLRGAIGHLSSRPASGTVALNY